MEEIGASAGNFLNIVGVLMSNIFLKIGSTIRKPIIKLISRYVSQSDLGKKPTTKRVNKTVRINRSIGLNNKYFFISFELIRYRISFPSVKVKSSINPGFKENIIASIVRLTNIQIVHKYRTLKNNKEILPIRKVKNAFVINSNTPKWIIRLFREISVFIAVIALSLFIPSILAHKPHKSLKGRL